MKEGEFQEGGALNSFGENFDFEGKIFTKTSIAMCSFLPIDTAAPIAVV